MKFLLLLMFFHSVSFARMVAVLRHGEALHNVQNLFNADIEKSKKYPLTEHGKQQLKQTAAALNTVLSVPIQAVYVSPLLRTQETAAVMTQVLDLYCRVILEPLLVESHYGSLEETLASEFQYGDHPADHRRAHDYGGETDEDVFLRMQNFLKLLKQEEGEGAILVVTHGTPAKEFEKLITGQALVKEFKQAEFRLFEID